MTKRNMVGLHIVGSLTVYEDNELIGSVDVTEDNRFRASGVEDAFGVFNDVREAVTAIQYHKPTKTAA
jgi:hypothetical protein